MRFEDTKRTFRNQLTFSRNQRRIQYMRQILVPSVMTTQVNRRRETSLMSTLRPKQPCLPIHLFTCHKYVFPADFFTEFSTYGRNEYTVTIRPTHNQSPHKCPAIHLLGILCHFWIPRMHSFTVLYSKILNISWICYFSIRYEIFFLYYGIHFPHLR